MTQDPGCEWKEAPLGGWGLAGARAKYCAAMSLKINWVISCGVGGTPWAANPCAFITDVEMISPNCLERLAGTRLQGDDMRVFLAEPVGPETQRRGQGKASIRRKR